MSTLLIRRASPLARLRLAIAVAVLIAVACFCGAILYAFAAKAFWPHATEMWLKLALFLLLMKGFEGIVGDLRKVLARVLDAHRDYVNEVRK